MTQEDNKTLLPILCGYLPYGLKVLYISGDGINTYTCDADMISVASETVGIYQISEPRPQVIWRGIETIKPYLRPLSSMTEEEKREIYDWLVENDVDWLDFNKLRFDQILISFDSSWLLVNWLNSKKFDYHGLIEKNLAIGVTKENDPYAN